jgi:transposase InsO family protein
MEADMALDPERVLQLRAAADALAAAGHGLKQSIADHWAGALGCTVKTLYRQITDAGFAQPRKRRADAGRRSVSKEEVMAVAMLKVQAQRANGKDIMSIGTATQMARDGGLAALGRVDATTGEVVPVATATIARAMREYKLDVDTMNRPKPHIRMRSLYPNHVWQIDASVCVLYYLDNGGMGVMEKDEFYKNKPESMHKRVKAMVIRYSATDHYSGTIFVRYYIGAESAAMVAEFFIAAIQAKGDAQEPFNGVPTILVLDPGSANGAHMFKNLCRLLQVRLIIHKPKSPRAKGQVENSHNIIECSFESRLIATAIKDLEELNRHAGIWMRWYNGTQKHRRHGHTRYGLWQVIRKDQLRVAPAIEVCRELLTTKPVERTVGGDLSIEFKGVNYRVDHIPGVRDKSKIMVAVNPYRENSVMVIDQDEHGNDVHWVCVAEAKDRAGFAASAAVWGEEFKSRPLTQANHDRAALDTMAYGTDEKLAIDAARRKRQPVCGGMDITGPLARKTPAAYMARPGTEMDVASPVATDFSGNSLAKPAELAVEARMLNLVQLATRLASAMPGTWSAWHYHQVAAWHPAGAAENEVAAIVARLQDFEEPQRLVAVGGA